MKLNESIYLFLLLLTAQTTFSQVNSFVGIEVGGAYNNSKIVKNEGSALAKAGINRLISTSLAANFTITRERNFLELSIGNLQSYWVSEVDLSAFENDFVKDPRNKRNYFFQSLIYGYSLGKPEKIKSRASIGAIHAAFVQIDREQEYTGIKYRGNDYELEKKYALLSENNKSHFGFISQLVFEKDLTKKVSTHLKIRSLVWKNRLVESREVTTILDDNPPEVGIINSYMPFLTVGLGISIRL